MARSTPTRSSRISQIGFSVMKPKRAAGRPLSPEHKERLANAMKQEMITQGLRDFLFQVIQEE